MITVTARATRSPLIAVACLLAAGGVAAGAGGEEEDRFAGVEVKSQLVSDNVYMLTGAGGNIGASVGEDGTLIIDDQFAPLGPRIIDTLTEIGGSVPELVLNTHFHGDHTGGNPFFGGDAAILAHDNVRARLLTREDFDRRGLPVVTFDDGIRVHFNGDTLEVIHLGAAHTDGDSVVWFKDANVLHTGDLLFNGAFPFIDLEHGGTVAGVVAGLERLSETLPEDVQIIPGHGPLADLEDLRTALDMIRETRATVTDALARGKSVDEIVAEGLAPRWESWGGGFIDEPRWIRTLAADAGSR